MTLSDRLQALRKSQNLSQEQLAEKLDVSRQAISKWESGQANPDINNILKLSDIYEVSTDYILTGKELDNQIVYKDHIVYKEKRGFNKLHDLPASIRVALAILIIAFGVFVVVPILFVISMELLGSIF
uniref:helix-turn-helix domain-containing protein n=1 Tax=Enterocloster clostridioformis TaxID=1531 RepID=UPI0026EC3AF8|nr:helix-turn-helix transcriptional regulator [Enterocloster clostridioformis]